MSFYFQPSAANSGNIGRSWALLFSCAEHLVCLCDNDPEQLAGVVDDLRGQLSLLKSRGLSRGHLEPEQQLKLITLSPDLAQCVQGADIIMVRAKTLSASTVA